MSEQLSLGIDIGGTKIAIALVDKQGNISNRKEYLSDKRSDETLFLTLTNGIDEVMNDSGLTIRDLKGFGIGIPGLVDLDKGVAVFQNNLPWENFLIVKKLNEYYGETLNVVIDNDVKMAAYAEYKMANLLQDEVFTYITLSTGIAATTIINNQILRGNGFSGEIGLDLIYTEEGYRTLEEVAAGPAIQKFVQDKLGDYSITTKQVFELYREGDSVAEKAINKSVHSMALSIYSLINLLDPKKIVLGGSVIYYNPFYIELLKDELKKILLDQQHHILDSISATTLGRDNGIIGAGLKVFN